MFVYGFMDFSLAENKRKINVNNLMLILIIISSPSHDRKSSLKSFTFSRNQFLSSVRRLRKKSKWIYTDIRAFILIKHDDDGDEARNRQKETLFQMFIILRFISMFERNLWMENNKKNHSKMYENVEITKLSKSFLIKI